MTSVPASPGGARDRGFTLTEVLVVVAISAAAFGTIPGLWLVSDELTKESQAALRAEAEHRHDLHALAWLVRGIPADTVAGLDANGRSTTPRFKTISEIRDGAVVLGAEERLEWVVDPAEPRSPAGERMGEIRHVRGTLQTSVARHVPEGSFSLTLAGRAATVRLTTVWRHPTTRAMRRLVGQETVFLRNGP